MFQPIDEDAIAKCVSELVLDAYTFPHKHFFGKLTHKQIDQLAKARAKSDEFTVLSGLVYWHGTDLSTMQIICLTTGVKCNPAIKIKNAKGRVLHDMHAEVLSMRSLSWFMLHEMQRIKKGEKSDIIEKFENPGENEFIYLDRYDKYILKRDVHFALYVSELPCGDCSLEEMERIDPSLTKWEEDLPSDDEKLQTILKRNLKSGEAYKIVGKVRLKPGRRDSPISYSKSCSDKLAITCLLGIFRGMITELMAFEHIGLDYLILPQDKVERNELSLKRCFEDRLINVEGVDFFQTIRILKCPNIITNKYKEILTNKGLGMIEIDREKKRRANELSIVAIIPAGVSEITNKGVKNGCNVERVIATAKGHSILSRHGMFLKRDLVDGCLNNYSGSSFMQWKQRLCNYYFSEKAYFLKYKMGYVNRPSEYDYFNLNSIKMCENGIRKKSRK